MRARSHQVTADSDRSPRATPLAAAVAALPSRAVARADTSPLNTTAAAAREQDAGGTVADDVNLSDMGAEAVLDSESPSGVAERVRNAAHSAAHQPHAVLLDVRNEHQRRRSRKRRGSAVGQVAVEQLPQARVFEVRPERRPQRRVRRRPPQRAHLRPADTARQLDRRRTLPLDERPSQRAVGLGAAPAKITEAARLGRTGESLDGIGRALEIRAEIEPPAIGPGVAGEDPGGDKLEVLGEAKPGVGVQLLEHPAHCEHRRPRIDRHAVDDDLAHLPAGCQRALDHRHGKALPREVYRRRQATDAGTDDDDPVGAR